MPMDNRGLFGRTDFSSNLHLFRPERGRVGRLNVTFKRKVLMLVLATLLMFLALFVMKIGRDPSASDSALLYNATISSNFTSESVNNTDPIKEDKLSEQDVVILKLFNDIKNMLLNGSNAPSPDYFQHSDTILQKSGGIHLPGEPKDFDDY